MLALLAVACALTAPAAAQEQDGPLRFLRPTLEGGPPPAEAAQPTPLEAPAADPQPVEPAPAQPAPAAEAEAEPEPAAPQLAPAAEAESAAPAPAPAAETQAEPAAPAQLPQPEAATAAEATPPPTEPPASDSSAPEQVEAPAANDEPTILRLGVIAGPDVMATITAVEPMAEGLRQALGRPVEILPMSSYGAMIDAQVQLRIDGGFYSAAAFAIAEAHCTCLEPIAAPAAADGTLAYHAIIVVRRDSGIASAADLNGRIVAASEADSIAGRRMQLASLMAEGIEPSRFGALRSVASPEEAVRLVVAGGADAAFAWSSLSGSEEAGYSRGTLTDLVGRGEIAMTDIAVIWRSPPVAHGPLAVLTSLGEEEKEEIEAYLLGLRDAVPAAYDSLSPYYGGGYVAVEPADYGGLQVLATQDVDAIEWPATPDPELRMRREE